ncbi:MAG: cytochrome P450 704B1 [Harvfovirus sp.]|uniref:Cytochrome P450 704B1 n=1 Tax=Harvfovirus sp. TaxID=2487768 RepID=A0A3G4ZZP7_9VIRU|nr:MAG: cytochrome P450 704B1 [Harvfovirus sp.]
MLLIVLLVLVVGFIVYERARYLKGVYRPKGTFPIIGNSIEFAKNVTLMHDWKLSHAKKAVALGHKCWQFSIFGKNALVLEILDPDLLKYVLKINADNFGKGGAFNETFGDLLGTGIFNSDGPPWKKHRAFISPIFSYKRLTEHMEGVFIKHARLMIDILEDASTFNKQIDLQDLFFRYTFDCICAIAFGFESNTLHSKNTFSVAFDNAQKIIFERMFTLPLLWKIKRALSCSSERELAASIRVLHNYISEIIRERKTKENADDLLSLALLAMDNSNGESHLIDLVLNVLIAGRDTTGCTLTWLFNIFASRADIDAKAYEEINRIIGDGGVNSDNIKELKYLEATIAETLRLYPPVPFDGKVSLKLCQLPNGLMIPPGTNICYSPYVINRLESLWENAESFLPERWLQGKNLTNISAYIFPTFNAGPRLCLGKPMALMEIKILAGVILNKFKFTRVSPREPTYNVNFVLSMKESLLVAVHHRES